MDTQLGLKGIAIFEFINTNKYAFEVELLLIERVAYLHIIKMPVQLTVILGLTSVKL